MKWLIVGLAILLGFTGGFFLAKGGDDSGQSVAGNQGRAGELNRSSLSGAEDPAGSGSLSGAGSARSSQDGRSAALTQEWLESLDSLEPFDQIGHLHQRLRDVHRSEFPALMDYLAENSFGTMSWQARTMLASRWAQVDPEGMLAYTREQTGNNARALYRIIFSAWAKQDAAGAYAAALQLDTQRDEHSAVQAVINSVAAEQPEQAIAMVHDYYGDNLGNQGRWLFRSLYQNWARVDGAAARASALALEGGAAKSAALAGSMADWMETAPMEALRWLDSLPTDSSIHGSRKEVFRQFLNRDFAVAKDYIESLPDASARREVLENLQFHNLTWQKSYAEIEGIFDWLGTVATGQTYDSRVSNLINAMANHDSERAVDFVLNMRAGNARMNSLGAIGRKLAENDPAEALAFVDSLPYEDERRRVLSNMNWTLRQQSIEVSSRLVAENRDPMVQQQLASGIAEEWSKYDVAGALAWSESLSDEQARKSAVGNVLGNWIESDPVATLRYIETNIDPEVQSSVLQSAFNSWSRSDPQEAASWLSRLPEGIDARLEPMYRSVANAYIQHDPMAASEWISGLSESPERDLSIETLVNNIANTDPEAGFMWASAMGNGNRRNNSLRRSVLAWKKLDEQAAYQAVIDARIDAEEKAPLLKIFEDGS